MHRLVRYDPHDPFSDALDMISLMRGGVRISLWPPGGAALVPADPIRWPST